MAAQKDQAEDKAEELEVVPVQAAPAPAPDAALEVSVALPAEVSVGALLASGSGSDAASDGSVEWEAVEDEGASAGPSQARAPGAQRVPQLVPLSQRTRRVLVLPRPLTMAPRVRRTRPQVPRRRRRARAGPPGASA